MDETPGEHTLSADRHNREISIMGLVSGGQTQYRQPNKKKESTQVLVVCWESYRDLPQRERLFIHDGKYA
jgi:hypothetical protein